ATQRVMRRRNSWRCPMRPMRSCAIFSLGRRLVTAIKPEPGALVAHKTIEDRGTDTELLGGGLPLLVVLHQRQRCEPGDFDVSIPRLRFFGRLWRRLGL